MAVAVGHVRVVMGEDEYFVFFIVLLSEVS